MVIFYFWSWLFCHFWSCLAMFGDFWQPEVAVNYYMYKIFFLSIFGFSIRLYLYLLMNLIIYLIIFLK